MPPIYRHVRPNVPAFTAGNGKPSYDMLSGKPVYQAVPIFEYEWLGYIDISEMAARWEADSGEPYEGPTVLTASELNAHLVEPEYENTRAYGAMEIESFSTSAGDAIDGTAFSAEHNELVVHRLRATDRDCGYRISAFFSVLWDASLAGWSWFAYTDWLEVHFLLLTFRARVPALFRQPLGTSAIRPGATGITIPFSSCSNPLFASAMANASLRVTSHH